MEFAIVRTPAINYYSEFLDRISEQNLTYSASEAAHKMQFDSSEEMLTAVGRAMELCLSHGLSVSHNFMRVFKIYPHGIICDWKLSELAYNLVQLNGNSSNPKVAELQIRVLKNNNF